MILKIYLAVCILAFVSFLLVEADILIRAKEKYNGDLSKIGKSNLAVLISSIISVVLLCIVPIVNIIYACIFLFGHDDVVENVMKQLEEPVDENGENAE